jgi:hypothetical protein
MVHIIIYEAVVVHAWIEWCCNTHVDMIHITLVLYNKHL